MANAESEMEESFEILDITGTNRGRNILERGMNTVSGYLDKYPVASRATIGGTGGYITGYVFKKVGRTAASAVGGGMILMQIAHKAGYITIDTNRMNRDARRLQHRVRREMHNNESTITNVMERAEEFIRNNSPAALGFIAGFFIGLST